MKWLTNTSNRDADIYLRELNADHIGPPKATKTYDIFQLMAMGMVGIYRKEE